MVIQIIRLLGKLSCFVLECVKAIDIGLYSVYWDYAVYKGIHSFLSHSLSSGWMDMRE